MCLCYLRTYSTVRRAFPMRPVVYRMLCILVVYSNMFSVDAFTGRVFRQI